MIEIHKSQGTILLDDEDAELATNLSIVRQPNGYLRVRRTVCKNPRRRKILARLILGLTDKTVEADHKNRNPLDNRRSNLRPATKSENRRNSGKCSKLSPFKGVTFDRCVHNTKKWRAYTRIKGKRIWLGYFATAEEAAKAYNEYASRVFGEFACLNIIGGSPPVGPSSTFNSGNVLTQKVGLLCW
jgi:hypothetical protein